MSDSQPYPDTKEAFDGQSSAKLLNARYTSSDR